MANLAGQRSLFLSKMSELEKPADGKEAGGLGAERSSFLSKAKYDDIVACLGQWECADKKVRRERWHQGHAWVKKYALFGTGSATVLMYLSDVQKQDVGAADTEDGVGEDGVAAPVEAALDKTVVVSHSGRVFEDLHAIHINGGHCKARTFLNRVKAQFGKSVPEFLNVPSDLQIRLVRRTVPTRAERICRLCFRICRFDSSADSFQLVRSRVCRF